VAEEQDPEEHELRKELQSLKNRIDRLEDKDSIENNNSSPSSVTGDKSSRRQFLKYVGLGAGGLALSSLTSGASLFQGTTINDETAWHAGNDGEGSGLYADLTDDSHFSTGTEKPSSPEDGTLFFDTGGGGVHYYNGTEWVGNQYTSDLR
jgi:hypothetical protein